MPLGFFIQCKKKRSPPTSDDIFSSPNASSGKISSPPLFFYFILAKFQDKIVAIIMLFLEGVERRGTYDSLSSATALIMIIIFTCCIGG